jgi:hypothetical protein
MLYGAIPSYGQNRACRYFEDERATLDGLKVWYRFSDLINGESNILYQTMQYLKLLEKPFSTSTPGGMLGYTDQMLQLLNKLDIIDPDFLHRTSHTEQQKISLILRRCSDVDPYARITYEYYTKMESEGRFYVEKYVDHLTRLCQNIDPQSVNMNPVHAYQVDTVQAYYVGQYRNSSTPPLQPSGYQNFLFLTKAEFDHMKTNHPELNDRLRNLCLEVAEALVPVCGPLPPILARAANNLKAGKTRPEPNRKDTVPTTTNNHTSGLPSQYPPHQTRANVVQR